MTEGQPYTQENLRSEAAQYVGDDWDSLSIIAAMSERDPWAQLPEAQFNEAYGAVLDLATASADLSDWAVGIGADELSADSRHVDIGPEQVDVRIHFAFHPQMPERLKRSVFDAVRKAAELSAKECEVAVECVECKDSGACNGGPCPLHPEVSLSRGDT